ncbi:hypothetical protein [Bacillus toyonensis]|uniref:hypothetical protein n=1 Tax=Bacillus toyonensis TaxID=155322 RepID=UPI000BF0E2D0|nr:hypothetical protein [Bacillus toyonensis]PEJ82924.1 hypothetical protein CN688_31875 [Bacillus toyonensis]PEK77503.1 hypothetical protein CN594_27295 [Bacillus toyonensis]PEL21564.1 hypothetical protein CN624_26045 [Bacillus toyonensis]PEO70882.1 hypothetical protein CN579_01035 [Bacillus toyonensis]PFY36802.1 hypothetical protein COL54_25560 [Bacillus toyonensis]
MTTISQNVLDTLVVGIYEDVQMLVTMMIDYEEEIDMVTKEDIIAAHEDLQEVILFCQSHSQGINVLLMEEVMIGINQNVAELFGEETTTEKSNTIYGEKLLLPEGISARKELDDLGFHYILHHETLGEIGQIIFPKENEHTLYFDVHISENVPKDIASAQIIKDIGDMLQKEILRIR